ncbi:MAG: hypothetical protein L0229_27775 [Blastocatellia bacterium]|nr:hypothetical protein [Blastocatellia bacterium]
MSESIQLKEPLFKLIVRFNNGEMVHHVTTAPLDARLIATDTRYAVISLYSCENPSDCIEISVINLRDVTFIKTERVTLDQLTAERRMAGLHSSGTTSADDRLPKSLAQVKFI